MTITFEARDAHRVGPADAEDGALIAVRERAFAVARRHSRLVRLLRIVLPLAAGGIMASYLLLVVATWHLNAGRIRVGSIQVTADDLKMKDPVYFGVTKEGGRYQVRAKRAVVSLNQNAPIKLIDVSGELTEANKAVTKLKAKHGLFDNAKGELELFDGIEIDGSTGMVARLSRAMIYQKDNRVVSKDPVTASTPTGSVQASAMTMNTKTRMVEFRGAVTVRLVPTAQGPVALGKDSRQPVDIYSDELDIDDAQKTAHFRGNVAATQGETTLKTPYLFARYEGKAAAGFASGASQPGEQSSRVTFLWARNGVDITAGSDRRILSDLADFDAKADTALFVGNVNVTQDKNILSGEKLFVDRKAGKSHLESPAEGGQPGRITASFYQSESKATAQAQAKPVTAPEQAQQNMFGSFKSDPSKPIEIEADTLDVHDGSKKAIFKGNVWAQQGDMVIRTTDLTAIFAGQGGFGLSNAGDGTSKAGSPQIVRVEARRKVLITSKDGQNATSDWADFDVKSNTALLGGGVIVMRGKDMAEGPRLKIDLTTGMYRFELESDSAASPAKAPPASAPATSSSSPTEAPEMRTCPPGKQCMLFYPKEAKDKANDLLKKVPSSDAR
jgi:lipopolysaccharide transport protein LptA